MFLKLSTIDVAGQEQNQEMNEGIIIDAVEYSASFPGGVDSLKSFIEKNLVQPIEKKAGKVFIAFIINKDGTTSDFEVLKGLTKECDERALEVMRKMPDWTPGTQRGKPIRQRFVMPIRFD